jgi:CubicO group peptidase (beta-lactamase class C family)
MRRAECAFSGSVKMPAVQSGYWRAVFLAFFVCLSLAVASEPDWQAIEVYQKATSIPTLQVCAIVNGNVYQRQLGEQHKPGLYCKLASVNKVLGAITTVRLMRSGRLHLGEPIHKFLPEADNRILVGHLLMHTSGIDHYKTKLPSSLTFSREKPAPLKEICNPFLRAPPAFAPGTKYLYSSYAYLALSAYIEESTKTPLATLMDESLGGMVRQRVLVPHFGGVELVKAFTGAVDNPSAIGNSRYEGWKWMGGGMALQNDKFEVFLQHLLSDKLRDELTLTEEMAREIETFTKDAGRWSITFADGICQRLSHGGQQQGFRSYLIVDYSRKAAILVIANCDWIEGKAWGEQVWKWFHQIADKGDK